MLTYDNIKRKMMCISAHFAKRIRLLLVAATEFLLERVRSYLFDCSLRRLLNFLAVFKSKIIASSLSE